MKISVIMPVYNGEKFLEKSLGSIINQKADVEVLLVEDGSSDNSYALCEEYRKKYKFIKLYRNDKKGTSSARNFALRHVTGDIVTFCDQDDYFEPDSFRKVIDYFSNNSIDVLISAFYSIVVEDKKYRGLDKNIIINNYDAIPMVINDLRITGCCWSKFYSKIVLKDMYFDEDLSYAEDIAFVCKVLFNHRDSKCLIVSDPMYNYYEGNPENLSNNVEKLFDANDNLKYNNCFNRIKQIASDDKKVCTEASYIIVTYSINVLRSLKINENRKKVLAHEIKKNLSSVIKLFFKYGFINNLKKLICAVGYILEYN